MRFNVDACQIIRVPNRYLSQALMPSLCFYFVKLFFIFEVLLLTYDILIVHKFLSQNILLKKLRNFSMKEHK